MQESKVRVGRVAKSKQKKLEGKAKSSSNGVRLWSMVPETSCGTVGKPCSCESETYRNVVSCSRAVVGTLQLLLLVSFRRACIVAQFS